MSALLDRLTAMEGRLTALEARLTRRRPETIGRRMTRPDRCPYGWRPDDRNPRLLVEAEPEQQVIRYLIGLAQKPLSYREMARRLDKEGFRRRKGKLWRGAHGLVRSILQREGIFSPADAEAALLRRLYRPIGG